ncbi:MAG TPA: hypothetical protein VGB13_04675 [Candidatus Krumholzibacteria bacterium]
MRKKRSVWTRTTTASRVTLCHFPKVEVRVAAQLKRWNWRVLVDNHGVALGTADSRSAGETAGIANVREFLSEIERACP